MEMVFRWYGGDDPVALEKIRQIPCVRGIVSAVYDVPAGEIWPESSVLSLKERIESAGLNFKVVESVPVHEDIKLGVNGCDRYMDNYCENIRRLANVGVEVICYNFMPVFDWMRSDLAKALPDGSNSLSYENESVIRLDPAESSLSLPGWDESYIGGQLGQLMEKYKSVDEEKLWENFERFINSIIPVCEEYGVKMAIHPDDPPWGIFGLPRIFKNCDSYKRLIRINSSPCNGVTLCTGSLGADPANDLSELIEMLGDRIHFAHIRNVMINGVRSFQETAHPSEYGSLDMYGIVNALYASGFDGFIRPDHGRMIWGETGKPGYGLYDRALGATYIAGLWEAVSKCPKKC